MMETAREVLVLLFLFTGALFMLVAAIGVVRMPDLLLRMQAATKAAALGAGLMFLAALFYFWDLAVTMRVIAAIVFIFLTLPLAAHLLARASYLSGGQIIEGTRVVLPEPDPERDDEGDTERRDT